MKNYVNNRGRIRSESNIFETSCICLNYCIKCTGHLKKWHWLHQNGIFYIYAKHIITTEIYHFGIFQLCHTINIVIQLRKKKFYSCILLFHD